MVSSMLTLKTSVAIAVLGGTAAVSAGAGWLVTKATAQANVAISCARPAAPATENYGLPLGGPPLPTDQGKKW
jgi:hypothetical protein